MKRPHTLVVLVEDHPGVLNRVVSLLRRRSFNIDSITVGHSEQPGISRMTLVVVGDDLEVEQAGKQLYKLLEVLKVTDVTDLPTISHEMCLVKVAAKAQHRQEILLIAQIYGARVVDASPSTLLMEMVGGQDKIDSLLAMLRPFGIRELVRTGAIAMTRGGSAMSGKGIGPVERGGDIAAD
ncbi:MAG: acetolactate synthase small subunit [Thermomicrobiales bacterium]|jgi:acetolactate synthase-1/3 small subunit|nr:acetolactate synthase small subunit [Thermomicrobiales bacterium]MEA2524768.1 acetolactate synthase small subunit [Thermomicrobiales bacterium]MEA2529727.1 acetolactate synthase small subunit [Thermomicrobiales bacterium]MEA2598538.1 acetolactate synthase small subunit [Thermomicrobiales bacterium]